MSVICRAPAKSNRRFQAPSRKPFPSKTQKKKDEFVMIRSFFGRVICENLGDDLRLKHYRRKPCEMMMDINTREIVASSNHEKLSNYFYKKFMQPRKVPRSESDGIFRGSTDNFTTAAVEHPVAVHEFNYYGLTGLIIKEGFVYCPIGLPDYGRGQYRSAQFRNNYGAPAVGTLILFNVRFDEFLKIFFVTECIANNVPIFHIWYNFEPFFKDFPLPVFRTWGRLLSPLQNGTIFVQTQEFGIVEDIRRAVRFDGFVWVTPLFTPPSSTLFCVVGQDRIEDPFLQPIVPTPWEIALNQLTMLARQYINLLAAASAPPPPPPQDHVVPPFAPQDPAPSPNPRRRRAYSESLPSKILRLELAPAVVENNQNAAPQEDFELPDQFPQQQRNEGELSPINQRIQQILQARQQNVPEPQESDDEEVPADPTSSPEDELDMP